LQSGFALAADPVLLSKDDIANCPNSFASATLFVGTTGLSAIIESSGQPTGVVVTASSGFQPLDEAAVDCFKKARFQPATNDGKPVKAPYHLDVKWEIPPGAPSCSPSMPMAGTLIVNIQSDNPPPVNTEAVVCNCADGSEPTILHSSGIARFDEGAIKIMKKGNERRTNRMAWCYAETVRYVPKTPGSN
jgi:TonB family protein